jgi:hypothetical protein
VKLMNLMYWAFGVMSRKKYWGYTLLVKAAGLQKITEKISFY